MKNFFSSPLTYIPGLLAVAAVLIASVIVNYNMGFYSVSHSEMYIPFFLGSASFLYKISYYPIIDLYYRARDLANLVDIFDTYFLVWSARFGIPHFLSGSYYLLLLPTVGIPILFSKKNFGNRGFWIAVLFTIAFLTSPAVFLSGMYFRPSKILVTLGASIGMMLFYRAGRAQSSGTRLSALLGITAFFLVFGMGISDEIGLAFGAIGTLYSITLYVLKRNAKTMFVMTGCIAGVAFLWAYRSYIGPYIVHAVTGLSPVIWGIEDLSFGNPDGIIQGVQLLLRWIQLFFGTIPTEFIIIPFAVCWFLSALMISSSRRLTVRSALLSLCYLTVIIGISFALVYVMLLRHPVIAWREYTLLYYPIPLYGLYYILLLFVSLSVSKKFSQTLPIIIVLCCIWISANMFALPSHYRTLLDPETKTSVYYRYTEKMIDALKHPNIPIESYKLEHIQAVQAIRNRL